MSSEVPTEAELPFKFLLRVALPAFLVFGVAHDEIYRGARDLHDVQALERLFQLDHGARQLPEIAEYLNDITLARNAEHVKMVNDGANTPMRIPFQEIRVGCKAALIGWVIDLSKALKGMPQLGRVFRTPDLEQLFDASTKHLCRIRVSPISRQCRAW